jgi:cytochrome P460
MSIRAASIPLWYRWSLRLELKPADRHLRPMDLPHQTVFHTASGFAAPSKLVHESPVRVAMKRKSKLAIAVTGTLLIVLGGAALYAQGKTNGNSVKASEKYTLVSPSGIAFADFKGYEDWSVVSSARTDEVLKVIVANPIMINAYKSGIPGNGNPFPEGSKIVKLQWTPKKSAEAPFVVDVPDVFKQAFMIEKDSKRFPKSGGWGYALLDYDAKDDRFSADPTGVADCGQACHVKVAAKDHIFHPYQKR